MKDHNGYVDLSSQVGHGTSFYIYFPITREDAGGDESEHLAGGTGTVLIVDDDDIQREVSSQLLKRLGYKVSSLESGEKAIEFLRENPQDLLILDMLMPDGIDGAETYRRILDISPSQKAIIVSGFSGSDRVFEAQKLGAGAFVQKPLTTKAIAAAVRTELDRQVEVPVS
jgi:DNA-binding NtrC family response regulator